MGKEQIFVYVFLIALITIAYSYLLYPLFLFFIYKFKGKRRKDYSSIENTLPETTLFIAAYNEVDFIEEKISNIKRLNYPKDRLRVLFITDGSNDGTTEIIKKHPEFNLLHEDIRQGKTAAINRGMRYVESPITVYSDCNTVMNEDALINIVLPFNDKTIGCVAGEKKIVQNEKDIAANSGEGFYWTYESKIKKWESSIHSTVGAAGELFAIRTELFKEISNDTILDDFSISMNVIKNGYKVKYEPESISTETGSASVKEELKRKYRISSGAFQAIPRLAFLLNPFKVGIVSFMFFSHKFLRWTVIPFLFPIVLGLNIYLTVFRFGNIFDILMVLQTLFYLLVIIGYLFEGKKIRAKLLFIPYYFFIMHFASYIGLSRHLRKTQSSSWERAKRG